MQLGKPAIIMLPTVRPPVLSLSTVACRSASCQGILGPPMSTLFTPICLTIRIDSSVISRPPTGAQIFGVMGPSWGIPGPCGPLSSVPSAAAAGNTVAAGKAADSAAVEQIPFIRALLEKSELIKNFSFERLSPWPHLLEEQPPDDESTLHAYGINRSLRYAS